MSAVDSLRITEIFYSLQGETRTMGLPTVFVRLTGCPLRCHYCDTAYAFHGGKRMAIVDIVKQVQSYNPRYVTVTGGEPLAQKGVHDLIPRLCDLGYEVSIETSGALDIKPLDARTVIVLDLKTPASGEMARNLYANLDHLKPNDQIKFVICNREDYDWARQMMESHQLARFEVLFSPMNPGQSPTELADWIVEDNLPVRFQVQLHKVLWGDIPGK